MILKYLWIIFNYFLFIQPNLLFCRVIRLITFLTATVRYLKHFADSVIYLRKVRI